MRHGGVGIHYDRGSLVISNLFQERRWVLTVIKHAHRQSLLGNEELPEELLQVQQACRLEKPHQPTHTQKHTQTQRRHQQNVIVMKKRKKCCHLTKAENNLPSFTPFLSPIFLPFLVFAIISSSLALTSPLYTSSTLHQWPFLTAGQLMTSSSPHYCKTYNHSSTVTHG